MNFVIFLSEFMTSQGHVKVETNLFPWRREHTKVTLHYRTQYKFGRQHLFHDLTVFKWNRETKAKAEANIVFDICTISLIFVASTFTRCEWSPSGPPGDVFPLQKYRSVTK